MVRKGNKMENIKFKLEKLKTLDSKIKDLQINGWINERIERLKAREEQSTTLLSDEPRGNSYRDKSDITIKRIELEDKYSQYIQKEKDNLADMIKEYTELIDTFPDENATIKQILKEYYILNKGWRGVAKSVNFSVVHTKRLAYKGIKILSER